MFFKFKIDMYAPDVNRLRLVLLLDTLLCVLYGALIITVTLVAGAEVAKRDGTSLHDLRWINLSLAGLFLFKAFASWRGREHGGYWLFLSLLIGLPLWLLPLLLGLLILLVPILDGGEPFASLWVVPGIYLGLFCIMGPTMALPIEAYPHWRAKRGRLG